MALRRAAVFLATVGGVGRIPWGPGTWGSLVGLGAGLLLLRAVPWPIALLALAIAWLLGAVLCSYVERHLGQHDPPLIVLDETLGMATVVAAWPLLTSSTASLLIAFVLFRAFDILKPPPLKRLARLPGGWGIMADDLGAAAYTVLVLWSIFRVIR